MDPEVQQSQVAAILGADPAAFQTLISHLMSSSNEQRSHAEALFNLCKQTDPDNLSLKLAHLLHSSPHHEGRAMSAILLRKQLTRDDSYLWPRLSPQTQSSLKSLLLSSIQTENSKSISKKLCDTISELASGILPDNDWPELLPFMFQCVSSDSPKLQESAFLIFAQLSQYIGDSLTPHIKHLHDIFLQCLTNPSVNPDVRIAALNAVINFIQCLSGSADRDRFQRRPSFSDAAAFRSPSPIFHPQQRLGNSTFRFFSSNFDKGFVQKVFDKPAVAVKSAFSRYREAIGLQIEAFCKRNYLFLLGAAGVILCGVLWRILFGVANLFVGISEGLAKYGFLALSSAIVAFTGLYIRSRFTINPDKVYRMAMTRLNTSAGILEVMGAPLSGTELRAYIMSGGGLTLKKFKPGIRSKRCFLIFPIRGSEKKGLVNVEVKKKNGQYDMKLLAVDVPMASGPDQRLYLIGDEQEYKVGGGLISELRDPVVKAMAATKEFDALDEIEEEEDAERERLETERKQREEIEKLEKSGTQ